jgi:hypothetical protein
MARGPASVAAFLRLWLLMVFSYVPLKVLYDLIGPGYIDLREVALVQLIALPTGQAIVFWLVTWRARPRGADAVTR